MFRTIVEDYEAKLLPADARHSGADARGKAEWERYGSGEEECLVRIRNVDLPDDTILDVRINQSAIGRIVLKNKKGLLRIESKHETVPRIVEKDIITISMNGIIILTGTFIPD